MRGGERQLTGDPGGHVLTNVSVFSPDGRWIVYDERSDREGARFDSRFIKRVDVETGTVETLYEARNGAFVGVVTYHPTLDRVVFIHGPEHPTPDWEYAGHHREGAIVDAAAPGTAIGLDARDLAPPFTPGALRGGSHLHVYDPAGEWLSFTYQDHVLSVLGQTGDHDLDQRNVGVSVPGRAVAVPASHPRNRDGTTFTVLVTATVNRPRPGSDEIDRAYEEGWIGRDGYAKGDGSRQRRAIAFLGDTRDGSGRTLTEVFVVDIPDDVTRAEPGRPIEGTATRRPAPPAGTVQRRVTFTADRRFPGVQGPRHWVRSSPDGRELAFLMKDDAGVVQIHGVSPAGGAVRAITRNAFPVASPFTWSPDGRWIAYAGDDTICVTGVASGETRRLTVKDPSRPILPLAVCFAPDGGSIAYQRSVPAGRQSWSQIVGVRL